MMPQAKRMKRNVTLQDVSNSFLSVCLVSSQLLGIRLSPRAFCCGCKRKPIRSIRGPKDRHVCRIALHRSVFRSHSLTQVLPMRFLLRMQAKTDQEQEWSL
jgi:hypothetical protein